MNHLNNKTRIIIGKAIEVHKELGPGLLESAYQKCLAYELKQAGFKVEMEKPIPIIYKEINIEYGYRIDLLIDDNPCFSQKTT